jgi:NAD(P)H-hydrate epimerase
VAILWADNDPDFANLRQELRQTSLIVDALLGTGVARPLGGQLAELLAVVKEELAAIGARPAAARPFAEGVPRAPLLEALGSRETARDDEWDDDWDDEGYDLDIERELQGLRLDPTRELPLSLPGSNGAPWDFEPEPPMVLAGALGGPLPLTWPLVPVLAVDCPTGLNCDTGSLDPVALNAWITVTFAYPKWGQVQYPGAGACGVLLVVDIGVPTELEADLPVELVERRDVLNWLPPRPNDANKGTFGKVMVAGGSPLYTGAPALSASAAAHSGAGLVTLAIPRELHPILAGSLLELTWLPLASVDGVHSAGGAAPLVRRLEGYDALLVGPGLTTEESAGQFLDALLGPEGLDAGAWRGRTVFDADALNLLAKRPDWSRLLPPESVLTPHPGEMSRLTGLSIEEINGSSIATARRYAQEWGHVVLLKGAHTVVAHPDGRASVLPFANPALAKAGSGDVLAGAIVSMIAQGLDSYRAAIAGGFIHGLAGVMAGVIEGPAAVTAKELQAMLPRALFDLAGPR